MEPPPKLEVRPKADLGQKVKGILIGTLIGILSEVGGYLLMRGNQQQFGDVVFIMVPLAAGFLIAIFTPRNTRVMGCAAGTILLTLSILIFTGLEGYICCFMALPLLLASVAAGAGLGTLIKERWLKGKSNSAGLKLLLLGCTVMLLIGARDLERPLINVPRQETFEKSINIFGSSENAWNLIKAMDKLGGPKPFLLKIGLALPESCEVSHEGVGGTRVCHFNCGIISQQITEWHPYESMRFKISQSTLPGRHWLKFVEAGYDFVPEGTNTLVIRKTTISSKLYPRWYWRLFESWGVQSEHEYVLNDLKRRAELATGKKP